MKTKIFPKTRLYEEISRTFLTGKMLKTAFQRRKKKENEISIEKYELPNVLFTIFFFFNNKNVNKSDRKNRVVERICNILWRSFFLIAEVVVPFHC